MAFEPWFQLSDGPTEAVTLRHQDVDVVEVFSTVETMCQVRARVDGGGSVQKVSHFFLGAPSGELPAIPVTTELGRKVLQIGLPSENDDWWEPRRFGVRVAVHGLGLASHCEGKNVLVHP